MSELSPMLRRLMKKTQERTERGKIERPIPELRARIKDAPPLISFAEAISGGLCLIAEIKQASPSMGTMKQENVEKAAEVYKRSAQVKAISVLTHPDFGPEMNLERLQKVKVETQKPVLRKDFITDEYEIYEARAFGADAVLLMANLLGKEQLARLHAVACELKMDVLFETHTADEIAKAPEGTRIYGINCRSFESRGKTFALSRLLGRWFGSRRDLTIDYSRFEYIRKLPGRSLKVAESGIGPERVKEVRDAGFNAILVGTSLLIGPRPIEQVLGEFERAILEDAKAQPTVSGSVPHATPAR
jgi:indole-3-glycerol phosphate synthase